MPLRRADSICSASAGIAPGVAQVADVGTLEVLEGVAIGLRGAQRGPDDAPVLGEHEGDLVLSREGIEAMPDVAEVACVGREASAPPEEDALPRGETGQAVHPEPFHALRGPSRPRPALFQKTLAQGDLAWNSANRAA